MSASVRVLVLVLFPLCGSTGASGGSGLLSSPTNVRLTSYNMNLVLSWDPPEGAAAGLVYTTEYRSAVVPYRPGCLNVSRLQCDFTGLSVSIIEYGKYAGRVRAQRGAESSAWVESNEITLDKDTVIGSPNVSLLSNGATLEVSIEDPELVISALRSVYTSVTYNITYWKEGREETARSISNRQQSRVVLSDLDVWTKYCVKVQINTQGNSNTHRPSRTVCERTTNKEEAPWVAAVVTFVVMTVAVALVVMAVVYRKRISHFLCPKDALPEHLEKYLLVAPSSSMSKAVQNSHPPEEIYHQVSIVAGGQAAEEGRPLEAAGTNCSTEPDVR